MGAMTVPAMRIMVGTLESYSEIKSVEYDLDEEDLTGTITVEFDASKI